MSRPAVAKIDLSALIHNYQFAKQLHGGRALAVVKANAYGHGSIECAHALESLADGFAVAFLEEAIVLRDSGIIKPILILEGFFSEDDLPLIVEYDLWTVVHHNEQIRMLESYSFPQKSLNIWLKVNSGMQRAGFQGDGVHDAYKRISLLSCVNNITLMTHFARADEPFLNDTLGQIAQFESITQNIHEDQSLCNSAGILGWPKAHRTWARPGIMLYGADPMPSRLNPLKPVMTLESQVIAVRSLNQGDTVGYGGTFTAPTNMTIGLVAMGYADGYPRVVPTGTPVAVDGHLSRIVGRVSMDMLTVDLSNVPNAHIGSKVQMWGDQVSVNTIADAAKTISYELLCNVKRVKFEYTTQ